MSQHYQLQPGEHEIIHETGMWNKAKLNVKTGTIVLTNKRILFVKDANPFAGVLIQMLMKKQGRHLTHDIDLKSIKSISNESFGLNKRILVLQLSGGETVKFSTSSDYTVWEAKLKELVLQPA